MTPRHFIRHLALLVALIAITACGRTDPPAPSDTTGTGAPAETTDAPPNEKRAFKSFIYDGPMPTSYQEAPDLTALVAEGKLPPVAQRLPEHPLVIPPVERIGKYGGTWRRAFTGPADGQNVDRLIHDHVIYYDIDGFTLVPHIAESWEILEDGKVFHFKLRKGMKWSDGTPFTADDFLFAYEDIFMNKDLRERGPPLWMRVGKEYGTVSKVDELTVKYAFPAPYYAFLEIIAGLNVAGQSASGGDDRKAPYAPKHYLKQFHPSYASTESIEQKVDEAGLGKWEELFILRATTHENPDLPVVGPWKMVQPITGQRFVLERNPYYWAVDPEGNQLPYIDRIVMSLEEDMETLNLGAIAGKLDMQHRHIQLAKYPLFKRNEKKGNYRMMLWPGLGGSECVVNLNQTYDADPEIARWLRTLKFRRALSLGIDRHEINETIFLGTGKPRAFVCAPSSPYYPGPEYEMKDAVHNVEEANRLLDEIGLGAKNDDGLRLRTDGKGTLILAVSVMTAAFLDYPGIAELLAQQWLDIGLKIDVRLEERTLFTARSQGNQHQATLWEGGGSEGIWYYPLFLVPLRKGAYFGPAAGTWYQSGGENGIEPNDAFKRLIELYNLGLGVPADQRVEYGREIFRIHSENLFTIGTVGLSPAFNGVVVVKNNFRNVPEIAPNSSPLQNPGIARTEQFFFE
ncbi:MAG: twin-arginine translocation pathway signal [Phycisphaeraceae bacterium]|nr:twin-arginine translocation pathway signal [Phycisphaeraceae bacterium]